MCCAERPRPGRDGEPASAFASLWSTSAGNAGLIARLLDTALTVAGLAKRAIAPEQSTTGYAAFQMIMRQFVVKEALIA